MKFEDPPPVPGGRYDWTRIARRATRKPGEWVQVYKVDRQTYAVAIRNNKIAALKRENGFQSRTASNNKTDRTCSLWVRYNPETDTRLHHKKGNI